MAREIRPTPTLKGKDAKRFLEEISNKTLSKEQEEFLKECDDVYNQVSKNSAKVLTKKDLIYRGIIPKE